MRKKKSWDKKWYTDEFLRELKATERLCLDGNLPIIEKHAPDAVSELGIDPRLLGGPLGRNAKLMALFPGFLLDCFSPKMTAGSLKRFRASCERSASAVCVKGGIDIKDAAVRAADGYSIPIRIYSSEKCASGCGCLYFMHGGAFVAGSMAPYDEAWKVFVEKLHMKVISVAYRLMPENPYPTGHKDCYRVLEWIYDNADALGIDKAHIFVCGDSAGGNMAQYCSTRAKGTEMVRGQLLLYAALNGFAIEDRYYQPRLKTNFIYEPKQKRLSRCITKQLEIMSKGFVELMGIAEPDPYINPYSFDASGNPPTFISVGALDYLKLDNLAWAHKLSDAGVPVKFVLYKGMGHGYLNAMGVFPQAEDLIDEMGSFIVENS